MFRKYFPIFASIIILVLFSIASSSQAYRFVAMSDSHGTLYKPTPEQVAAAIKKTNPAFVLHSGDFTCCGSAGKFSFREFAFLDGIPIFPTTGNHDFDNSNAQKDYDSFWIARIPSKKISGIWAHNYSFDHGDFHFVALDWKKPDFEWLKKDLKTNDGKPTAIFSHLAAKNVGCKPSYSKTLAAVAAEDRDIKVVFSGNSHCYGVYPIKDGTLQIFTGTVSHDNGRDAKYKRKHTFVVVDAEDKKLKICPASVEDGIYSADCTNIR